MKFPPSQVLDVSTRWIAAVAAACALSLSAYLAGSLNSTKLPATVSTEKLTSPPSLALDLEDASPAPTGAARVAAASRLWFTITIKSSATSGESTVASFANGLVVPDAVWLIDPAEGTADGKKPLRLQILDSSFGRYVKIASDERSGTLTLLARVSSPGGVGQPKVSLLREADIADAATSQSVHTASITAIFLILACFSAAVAASSRDWTFLIFAGWLLTSLRMVAVNGGWGLRWLAGITSEPILGPLLLVSISTYSLFTIALFRALLKPQLSQFRVRHIFFALQSTFLALALFATVLPSTTFYPVFWLASGLSIVLMLATSGWIAVSRRDSVAAMLFATWALTLGGMTAEMLYNAGISGTALASFNAETGALAGALVCAFALAHRLKVEIVGRRDASNRESLASAKLKRNYESMPLGLFGCDVNGKIHIHNPAFAELFKLVTGYAPQESHSELKDLVGGNWAALLRSTDGANSASLIEITEHASGHPVFLQLNVRQNQSQFEGTAENVTARVSAERSLARLVDHDVLTKALNQRGLNDAVARALADTANGLQCSLVEIDIDRFKTLNDLYGHLVGDQLLSVACDRLLAVVGESDAVARIGDSFRVLLVDSDPDASASTAHRLHQALSSSPLDVGGRLLAITASIGVVVLDSSMSVRDAIAASSQACADAKAKGRNRIIHFGKQDIALRGYLEELKVQTNLQDKINSQRFFLEFQPIVSLRSAFETLNYEVLVRMRGENGATISPVRFIPAAERNGQMSFIDRWVLTSTLQWLDSRPQHLQRLGYATINLSGSSLNDGRFVDNIFAMIADHPSVMSKLCFEITETVALADRNATRRFSERVHTLGAKVALDDFGAGYTSFTYLREIEADIIKIDGSFVRDINQNPANHAITRMIVELSHELGKRCVAEWAEKPDVIATLMQLGVDFGQGFGLARPMPPQSLLFASSSGDLVADPNVRALLKGTVTPDQVAASSTWGLQQATLF